MISLSQYLNTEALVNCKFKTQKIFNETQEYEN